MKSSLFRGSLRLFGWKVVVTLPDYSKCVICVAPHTSNWDFILGKLAYGSIGRKAGFLMKKEWFFFPLGYLFRAMGGIPVDRKSSSSLTDQLADRFEIIPSGNVEKEMTEIKNFYRNRQGKHPENFAI